MPANGTWTDGFRARAAAAALLIVLAQLLFDGAVGATLGVFALAWVVVLLLVRRAVLRVTHARVAAAAAAGFALVLVDDPSLLAWTLFWVAVSLAALLPRHRFDDALHWAARLAAHAAWSLVAPWREGGRLARIARRRERGPGGVRRVVRLLVLPVVGGTVFVALFAGANPVLAQAINWLALPKPWTLIWRTIFATLVLMAVWSSLRPGAWVTRDRRLVTPALAVPDPGVATLVLSLVTFNLIFLVQNLLDVAFLWSGAPLPGTVTMADYARRGAYALIVAALLAAVFVLAALRSGSAGARSGAVRMLVSVWIAQTVLLVASSALRTLDYVDAYGMTVLRLAALGWMALVAVGLALIGWRLLAGKSAAWLVNANAAAAAVVLAVASVVDLGATAAAWNARVALVRGAGGPPLDLCYMAALGPSALVPLARLEVHARQPAVRDRIAWLRWNAQWRVATDQADWRAWTPRAARRLAAAETLVGGRRPALRPAPDGRDCDGSILPPALPPVAAPQALPPAAPLTPAPQR